MSIISGIAVYLLIWWVVMFCVLPFDIQSIAKPTGGTMPGAPVKHGLKWKAMVTTIIAGGVWLVIYLIIKADLISFHEIAQRMTR